MNPWQLVSQWKRLMYDNDVPDRAEAGKVEVAEGKDS